MSSAYQSGISSARVNIQSSIHTSCVQKKVELSLKPGVARDYRNGTERRPLSRREKTNVNKDNFDSVFAGFASASGKSTGQEQQ